MPSPSLAVSYNRTLTDILRLETYRNSSLTLEPKYQHLISEVILLRLFSLIENYIKDICCKLACSAPYRSGAIPVLIQTCTSVTNALYQFENFNRPSQKSSKWTNSNYSNNSIKKVIPATEKIRIQLGNHSILFDEMRMVRNHVAHKTSSTLVNYKIIVRNTFGANLNISTGAFLVSTKRIHVAKIDYYIAASKIFINDLSS